MSISPSSNEPAHTVRWQLPPSLRRQLRAFRRRLWTIKMIEALGMALVAFCVAFLVTWALDRRWDTPAAIRLVMLLTSAAASLSIPVVWYRWIWRQRRPHQLARCWARKLPYAGDAVLGVIELTDSTAEQARSPMLCRAAIDQVATQLRTTDLLAGLPRSRHRGWLVVAGAAALVVAAAWATFPSASANAWSRLLTPWRAVPRYTFTRIDRLPNPLVVPHGEPVRLSIALRPQSRWRPRQASLRIGDQRPLAALRAQHSYLFAIPPQIAPAPLWLRTGDATQQVLIQPTLRPELVSVLAEITLPAYLGRPAAVEHDVRGGSLTLVKGSRLRLTVAASRTLATARIADRVYPADAGKVRSDSVRTDDSPVISIAWQDTLGLTQREPFVLEVHSIDDAAPALRWEVPPQKGVVLDTELLTFQVQAEDDFGIRAVGMQWQPAASPEPPSDTSQPSPSVGQQPLSAGGPMMQRLDATGAFHAKALGIPPQAIELRVWAEDYLPDRPRTYSPPITLSIVSSDEHALWLADQLARWYGQALEVRDRELQLHETNRQLRDAFAEGPAAEMRQRIEQQASDERDNGRRLAQITRDGQQLLRTAARNPEMEAKHLERWAQTLQVLQDIAGNRMPSVADLLSEAAAASQNESKPDDRPRSLAGTDRAAAAEASAAGDESADAEITPPATPKVVDVESSQVPPPPKVAAGSPPPPGGPQRLGLASTTLLGDAGGDAASETSDPPAAPAEMKQAVAQQQQLLEQFDQVADELSSLLANLEGSTLVKRFKAASRAQYRITSGIAAQLEESFAVVPGPTEDAERNALARLAAEQSQMASEISLLMGDMQASIDRRRQIPVQAVLQQMRAADVLGGMRELAADIAEQQGLALAAGEYWTDALDRWAEDLVPPAAGGQAPGAPAAASLPPGIVLRVLQVLQAEVDLRESTRVAQQAHEALSSEDYERQAMQLASDQREVQKRLQQVVADISQLPGGESAYATDLGQLKSVLPAMDDAVTILSTPDTGAAAVAAETEAIELLLQSNRVNPGAGGGGGGTAGSGGGGGAEPPSPLALLGVGINRQEHRRSPNTPQSVGAAGAGLPEEFRAGLDEYFNRLEP